MIVQCPPPKMAAISRTSLTPPVMAKGSYLFQNIDLEKHWKYCMELQHQWSRNFSKPPDGNLAWMMNLFRKNSAITFVWVSEQLDGGGISQPRTFYYLSELYDNPAQRSMDTVSPGWSHLKQHLLALIEILKAADEKQSLSEDLILSVHNILMLGHGDVVGGGYREVPASMGSHIFPDHTNIPDIMRELISEYNSESDRKCDSFERASQLLLRISSLHPFEDGNGRLGRLLWCFSLLRDGLPFPPILLNDRDKYRKCIIEDSRMLQLQDKIGYCPCLISLTVVCIREKWENFINNLSLEDPEGCSMIVTFLSQNGIE